MRTCTTVSCINGVLDGGLPLLHLRLKVILTLHSLYSLYSSTPFLSKFISRACEQYVYYRTCLAPLHHLFLLLLFDITIDSLHIHLDMTGPTCRCTLHHSHIYLFFNFFCTVLRNLHGQGACPICSTCTNSSMLGSVSGGGIPKVLLHLLGWKITHMLPGQ